VAALEIVLVIGLLMFLVNCLGNIEGTLSQIKAELEHLNRSVDKATEKPDEWEEE